MAFKLKFWEKAPKVETHDEKMARALMGNNDNENEITPGIGKMATFNGYEYPVVNRIYDGEKEQGELGAPVSYNMSYRTLQARGWQIYTESDIAKTLVRTLVDGVLGSGLKCQSQPIKEMIPEIVEKQLVDLKKQMELRFRLYTEDNNSTYSKMNNFHELTREQYEAMIVGGDCLQVFRYDNGPNKEVIDGRLIQSPDISMEEKARKRGNVIINGVEINKKTREHVAYYVLQSDLTYNRIPRKSPLGRIQACMVYGDKYRSDSVRGMPLMIRSIEKIKKMDRYIEAMVGGAEERAKIPFFFEHNHFSTGENPMMKAILDAAKMGEGAQNLPLYDGAALIEAGKKIAEVSGKTPANLPVGATMKAIDSTVELRLRDFCDGTFLYICASLGIPIEIALSKFEQSFSASRMASEIWKMQVKLYRKQIERNIYQPFYNYFIDTEVKIGRLSIPGYEAAVSSEDIIKLQAYRSARFTGHGVPNADPVKEVKAVVLMLQNNLVSHEQAAELLADTEWDAVIDKLGAEYEVIKSVIPIEYQRPPNAETDSAELPDEGESAE